MIIVLTTVAKKSDAEMLARKLVTAKVAACINIFSIGKSVYRWEGKTREKKEFLLLIKTSLPNKRVERFIRKIHPYELPEIIALPVSGGWLPYLRWVKNPK